MEEECSLLKKQTLIAPPREVEDHGFTDISDLQSENQRLIASLQELQNVMQVHSEKCEFESKPKKHSLL